MNKKLYLRNDKIFKVNNNLKLMFCIQCSSNINVDKRRFRKYFSILIMLFKKGTAHQCVK